MTYRISDALERISSTLTTAFKHVQENEMCYAHVFAAVYSVERQRGSCHDECIAMAKDAAARALRGFAQTKVTNTSETTRAS